jgi:putative aldouronate transport system substrate-binding protein
LTAFKTQKGATNPLLLSPTGDAFFGNDWVGGFGTITGMLQKDGTVYYGPLMPEYKAYLETFSKWYTEGLIDRDFTTRTNPFDQSLVYSNAAGVWQYFSGGSYESLNKQPQDPNFVSVAVQNPVLNKGDKPLHGNMRDQSPPDTGVSVSTDCEHPDYAVKIMDYFYSDEGALLANYGIEGVTFDYNADGKPVLKDLIAKNPDGLSMTAAQGVFLVHSGAMVFMLGREEDTLNKESLEYKTLWNVTFPRQLPNSLTFTDAESQELSAIMSDLTTFVQETACQYIMGTKSFSEYDAFVEQVRSMNIDRAIEIYQTSYDRYLKR